MKSGMRFTSLWFGAVLTAATLSSAYALNPQPLPPGVNGAQRGASPAAEKSMGAKSQGHGYTGGVQPPGIRSGAAMKADKAGMSAPAGREAAAGAGKKPGMAAAQKGYLKMDLPAVQRR